MTSEGPTSILKDTSAPSHHLPLLASTSNPARNFQQLFEASGFPTHSGDGPSDNDAQPQRAFCGEGRRLGYTTAISPVMAATVRDLRRLSLQIYHNGFVLDDGSFISFDSEEGRDGMEAMSQGFTPPFLLHMFPRQDIDVVLVDRLATTYKPEEHQTASLDRQQLPSSPSAAAAPTQETANQRWEFQDFDPSKESAALRLRAEGGEVHEVMVNPHVHTVARLYDLIESLMGCSGSKRVLKVRDECAMRELEYSDTTLSDSGACRSVIIIAEVRH